MSSSFYRDLIKGDDAVLLALCSLYFEAQGVISKQEHLDRIDRTLDERLRHMQARDKHEINELIREAITPSPASKRNKP